MVDSVVQSHRPNVELIAAQALGTIIGIKLATPVVNQLNAYHAAQATERTPTRREAEQPQAANRKPKQPTLFNHKYSKESLKATALPDTEQSVITQSPDDESLIGPLTSADVLAKLNEGRFNWPDEHMAITGQDVKLNGQLSGLGTGLWNDFIREAIAPDTMIGGSMEFFGKRIERFEVVGKYNRYSIYAQNGAVRVIDNIGEVTKASEMHQRYTSLVTKYGVYAKGAEFIEGAGRLVLPADIAQGVFNVLEAESDKKLQTAFEETGRVAGGYLAGTLVGLAAAGGEVFSLGTMTPLAIGAVVAATAAGATAGKKFGHYLYTKIEDQGPPVENLRHEMHHEF